MTHRRTITILLAILAVAVVGIVLAGRHFKPSSATNRSGSVKAAEARATYLINEASVGGLDADGQAELKALIRRYHLVADAPIPCTQKTTATGTELTCIHKLGYHQATHAS